MKSHNPEILHEHRVHMDDNLLSRKIKNLGKSAVTIRQDEKFTEHVIRHHKKPVDTFTLHPNETAILRNFYIIATSADGKEIQLQHTFYNE